ncbi:MAG: redoxin domain-containing protein [Firmicutes bacterium]|nr:redoxin domain-containing protein [Bacillota bacterium]
MKKKLIVLLIVIAMILVAACGKSGGENAGGNASGNDGGSTENGGTSDSGSTGEDGDVYYTPESGMTIPASKTYAENEDKVYLYYGGGEAEEGLYYMEFYLYPATWDELEKMSDDDYFAAEDNAINVLLFLKALDSKWPKDDLEKWCNWMLGMEPGTLQEHGKHTGSEEGDYTIYYSLATEYPDTVPEDIKPIYDGIIADFTAARSELLISEPLTIDDYISGQVIEFETTDLDGNTVSSKDIFAKNKYTMINIWASWCGPCVQELPELEELNKEFEAKGCGIIGLLTDGTDPTGLADAKEILETAGVTYLNVIDSTGVANMLQVNAVPTSVFVDSEGRIVGTSVVGADLKSYKSVMEGLLGE